METQRFANKVAIITGGGRGIGREEALLLASHGARVVVNDLGGSTDGTGADTSVAQAVVDQIVAAGGTAVANGDDVSSMDGAERLAQTAIEAFGRIDILINNATIIRPNDLYAMTEEEWDAVLRVNIKATFATVRAAAPHFIAQGEGGVILNTSSEAGLGLAAMANYSAGKEAVVGFTRTAALELGRFGIRVNAIRPRAATAGAQSYLEKFGRWNPLHAAVFGATMTTADTGTPESTQPVETPADVANVAVWLCSDATRNVNGHTFVVHGAEFGLYKEAEYEVLLRRDGGWDLNSLDERAVPEMTAPLSNPFLFALRLPGEEGW